MKEFYRRNKRVILIVLFILLLGVFGIACLDYNLEHTGLVFLQSALLTSLYLPVTWGLAKFKFIKIDGLRLSKEIYTSMLLFSLVVLYGLIDACFRNEEFTLFFTMLLLLSLTLGYFYFRNDRATRNQTIGKNDKFLLSLAFWFFVIGFGAVILFLDGAGNDDALAAMSLVYFPLLLFFVIRWIFNQIRTVVKLKNEQAKTELLHLKSQVSPHFFFNTLNNLYGLVEKDSKKARTLILKLSDMMRYSIYEGQKDEVTLREEVEYLKNYIELHKMRYHKEINIEFNLDIQNEDLKIMPLLFIILLENAFKHGVENLIEDPFVRVNITGKENEIGFIVENNFDASEVKEQSGIGLKNLKRRLELVYQNNHVLSFLEKENVFKVELSIRDL